ARPAPPHAHALDIAHLQMTDAGERAGDDGRRERGGEDEAWGIGAEGVAAGLCRGDITAHHAEALGERAIDDVDAMHHVLALSDTAAARAVKADRMHFVEISERVVLFGKV